MLITPLSRPISLLRFQMCRFVTPEDVIQIRFTSSVIQKHNIHRFATRLPNRKTSFRHPKKGNHLEINPNGCLTRFHRSRSFARNLPNLLEIYKLTLCDCPLSVTFSLGPDFIPLKARQHTLTGQDRLSSCLWATF